MTAESLNNEKRLVTCQPRGGSWRKRARKHRVAEGLTQPVDTCLASPNRGPASRHVFELLRGVKTHHLAVNRYCACHSRLLIRLPSGPLPRAQRASGNQWEERRGLGA